MKREDDASTLRTEEPAAGKARHQWVLRGVLPGDETAVPLAGDAWVLGRSAECAVRLETSRVSRRHAEIRRTGPLFSILDLGSSNGTFVDGTRTEHGPLHAGAVIRCGDWLGVVEEHPAEEDGPCHARELVKGLWGGRLLHRTLAPLLRAAQSNLPIVLIGATGTGKERFARVLQQGQSGDRPFHAINCAALPETLAEAELFGFRKGAFTGADRSYQGHLRAAEGGTLLLDEVADLPLALQAKLLRALDTGEIAPLGDTAPSRFDARIVAACQRPLSELVAAGRFREDLAARLSGLVVTLPELRERRGDVPVLFHEFLQRHAAGTAPAVSTRLHEALCLHEWPANVRELELLARNLLAVHGLAPILRESHWSPRPERPERPEHGEAASARAARPAPERDVERLTRALTEAGGNVRRAAELAGLSRQKAYRLIGSRRLAPLVSASRRAEPEQHDDSGQ